MSASFIEMADGHHLEFLKTLDDDTRSSPWKFILDKVNGCKEAAVKSTLIVIPWPPSWILTYWYVVIVIWGQKWIPTVKFNTVTCITHWLTPNNNKVIGARIIKMAAGRHLQFLKTLNDGTRSSPWKLILGPYTIRIRWEKNFNGQKGVPLKSAFGHLDYCTTTRLIAHMKVLAELNNYFK